MSAPSTHAAEASQRLTIAVFPIQGKLGLQADLAELVSDRVLQEVRRRASVTTVLSPTEITQLMPAAEQRTVLECASDECSLIDNELAGALGATHIIIGNVSKLARSYQLSVKLFELKRGLVVAHIEDRIAGETAEALLDGVKPAVVKLLMLAGMNKFPTAAMFPVSRKLSTDTATADRFSASLLTQLRRWDAFDLVLGPSELGQFMTPEQQHVVTACAQDECSVVDEDLIGGLGVTHVVLGTVAKADRSYLITVKLIHIKSGLAVATVTESSPMKDAALNALATPLVVKLLVQAKLMREPSAAALEGEREKSGRPWPLWAVAGGTGALGGSSVVVTLASLVLAAGVLTLNLVPDLKRPLVSPLSLQARAFVLQAPLVGLGGVGLGAVLLTSISLLVSGVSAVAALVRTAAGAGS